MIYVGGFFGDDPAYAGRFAEAFGNTDAFVGLPWGGIIALVLTVIYLVARKVVTFKEAMECVPKGFIAMISPILILTLAVSLKSTINQLGAAEFVQTMMFSASKTLYSLLEGLQEPVESLELRLNIRADEPREAAQEISLSDMAKTLREEREGNFAGTDSYLEQVESLVAAFGEGGLEGVQAAMEIWNGFDDSLQQSIAETYPS